MLKSDLKALTSTSKGYKLTRWAKCAICTVLTTKNRRICNVSQEHQQEEQQQLLNS